jgi:zinc transporter
MDTVVYALDGKGGCSLVGLNEIKPDGLHWVKTTVDQVESVLTTLGITTAVISRVLMAKETRPRSQVYNDALIATFRCAKMDDEEEIDDMVSVRLCIQANLIITAQRRKAQPIELLESALQDGCGVKTQAKFLEKFLSLATDEMLDVISDLGESLDHVEDALAVQVDNSDRQLLSSIRRQIILLSRYVTPQREAINRLTLEKIAWFQDIDYLNMREISDACTRLLENIRNEEERATVVHEEFYAYAQERLNQKMYLLTIIASIFMPLTFITGLLGINVGGIPGANYKHGFLAVCSILVVIFVIQYIWLKVRKWFD